MIKECLIKNKALLFWGLQKVNISLELPDLWYENDRHAILKKAGSISAFIQFNYIFFKQN